MAFSSMMILVAMVVLCLAVSTTTAQFFGGYPYWGYGGYGGMGMMGGLGGLSWGGLGYGMWGR